MTYYVPDLGDAPGGTMVNESDKAPGIMGDSFFHL